MIIFDYARSSYYVFDEINAAIISGSAFFNWLFNIGAVTPLRRNPRSRR